jgi:hypothetical protein
MGFVFDGRNSPRSPGERVWVTYCRGQQLLSVCFEQNDACLIAELLEDDGEYRSVAVTGLDQPPSTSDLMAKIEEFTAAVTAFIAGYPPSRS